MGKDILNIVIGGPAGEGLVTVGALLARALVRSGYAIVVTQSYHSRIRGGHNTFAIRTSTKDTIFAPQEPIDLLMPFDEHTIVLHAKDVVRGGVILADEACAVASDTVVKIPFKALAADGFFNIAALGIMASVIGLEKAVAVATLHDLFDAKHHDVAAENKAVLSRAYEWAQENVSAETIRLNAPEHAYSRLMMHGNEAIALGALSAGVKFCSFYPMTPATSIMLALAAQANDMGIIVEQAEDEIAAINMAVGASFAGAPSMVATSGGGFALMVEGVSLAAMTETPLVIVVAQRPGPATGLPTRTEQGDLELVLHAGHGEFPRAIYAPGTPEECFYLTRRAFESAQQFQGPMFVLTDQFLADSYRAVLPFDLEKLPSFIPVLPSVDPGADYRRYLLTENGISPRLVPGVSRHLVVADSDEHTDDGHLTEDLCVRKQMVEKRLGKGEGMKESTIPPEFIGDENPDLLFVSWGSTKGAVRETVAALQQHGASCASLHFSQVWPLNEDQCLKILTNAGEVVCVEGNATGQFARLLRRETGFAIKKRIARYDGLPITPASIMEQLPGSS
ncbi:MAG: 2-oxoacid:acceptor oxidoreductase subunit alpha [Deltaproteobacteria bacterium]|nr:2-oxoacid:acceptor oxidoreductase subunit alpha [Deltaproteobacteria bacterium]